MCGSVQYERPVGHSACMTTSIEIIGTRIANAAAYTRLFEECGGAPGRSMNIASAYWDVKAVKYVRDVAIETGSTARLLLWTEGASKSTWRNAEFVRDDPHLDVRMVDNPASDGIFHVKLGGVSEPTGDWSCAVVGSCNLTARGLSSNVELGVVVRNDHAALNQLRDWYHLQFDHATAAAGIDWNAAIECAPDAIPRGHGHGPSNEALASPAHAGPIVPAPKIGSALGLQPDENGLRLTPHVLKRGNAHRGAASFSVLGTPTQDGSHRTIWLEFAAGPIASHEATLYDRPDWHAWEIRLSRPVLNAYAEAGVKPNSVIALSRGANSDILKARLIEP